ncbi:MAG: methyltransferase [Syntrophobacteraceae bacterium]|jgi:hypothetical protein|nr:methyltransferase [Syntrophobacteraceae bacterium]
MDTNERFPSFKRHGDILKLRDALDRAGYRDSSILDLLGLKDFPSLRGTDLPLLLRRTGGGSPLETLVRIFLMEVPVSMDSLEAAVHPLEPGALLRSGLVEISGDEALGTVRIIPFQEMLLAFDLPRRLKTPDHRDYVMGIGRSSHTLANLTVRSPSRATLDLGCGCGIQGLLAARHSETVLAVDLNPRAVRFTAFNAGLNGLDNVQAAVGDRFKPADGRRFDLIVSNPPFVISPENQYTYRDGGMIGDEMCRSIVKTAPAYLREGGFCQVLCNWCQFAGQDWRERLAGWFQGSGCDVWVLRSETRDAATYASTWIQHTEHHQPERLVERFHEWMAYYERQGIDSVGAGLITMRRRSGSNHWFRADDAPEKMIGPCGRDILHAFTARDWLQKAGDRERWLASAFRLNPDTRLEQTFQPSRDGWEEIEVRLTRTSGLAHSIRVDVAAANLLARCDGSRPLGELASALAASLEVDRDSLIEPVLTLVGNLVESGFLEPSDSLGDPELSSEEDFS